MAEMRRVKRIEVLYFSLIFFFFFFFVCFKLTLLFFFLFFLRLDDRRYVEVAVTAFLYTRQINSKQRNILCVVKTRHLLCDFHFYFLLFWRKKKKKKKKRRRDRAEKQYTHTYYIQEGKSLFLNLVLDLSLRGKTKKEFQYARVYFVTKEKD